MQVRVIESYQTLYPDPISFFAGETVRILRRDDAYPNWVWVATADGNEGWAPEQYLEIGDAGAATARTAQDYSAIELNVEVGQILTVHYEVNRWYWATNSAGLTGWVPARITVPA